MLLKMTLSQAPSSRTPISIPRWFQKSFRLKNGQKLAKNGQKLAKYGNLTLKYDHLTLKMTSGAIENDTVKLAVLRNPNIDTKIIFLALLEVTLAQGSS